MEYGIFHIVGNAGFISSIVGAAGRPSTGVHLVVVRGVQVWIGDLIWKLE